MAWWGCAAPRCLQTAVPNHAHVFAVVFARLQDGSMFKARVTHAPYFYLQIRVSPDGSCGGCGSSGGNSSS